MISLQDLQHKIKENDYNQENPNGYLLKLMEELGELAESIRKDAKYIYSQNNFKDSINEELYDCLYYICALANIYDVNLTESHQIKSEINMKRYLKPSK